MSLSFCSANLKPRAIVLLAWLFCSMTASAQVMGGGLMGDDWLSQATLVVYNSNDPSSKALAKFYAKQRQIPKDQVVGLKCSAHQEISRDEFNETILNPLVKQFHDKGWWITQQIEGNTIIIASKIRFAALMRGVPLKVLKEPLPPGKQPPTNPFGQVNEASVDSELAVIGVVIPDQIEGYINNPYFSRFLSIFDAGIPQILLVCRIDAPKLETAYRIIRDSIEVEKNRLYGQAYVDIRGLPKSAHSHYVGDQWLRQVVEDLRLYGIPTIVDERPGLFPTGYPMANAALYYGWYATDVSESFLNPNFRFKKGAIACHIHSFSAKNLRIDSKTWTGPLIERGAAASIGNVFEPYLQFTHKLDTLNNRLMSGFTLAESAYMSIRGLSWVNIVVGDPLYRPFPRKDILKEGAPNASREDDIWQLLTEQTLEWNKGEKIAATEQLEEAGHRFKSGLIFEDLGLLQRADRHFERALSSFETAHRYYAGIDDRIRVVIHRLEVLLEQKKKPQAIKELKDAIALYGHRYEAASLKAYLLELTPPPPIPVTERKK